MPSQWTNFLLCNATRLPAPKHQQSCRQKTQHQWWAQTNPAWRDCPVVTLGNPETMSLDTKSCWRQVGTIWKRSFRNKLNKNQIYSNLMVRNVARQVQAQTYQPEFYKMLTPGRGFTKWLCLNTSISPEITWHEITWYIAIQNASKCSVHHVSLQKHHVARSNSTFPSFSSFHLFPTSSKWSSCARTCQA